MDAGLRVRNSVWRAGGLMRLGLLVLACVTNALRCSQAVHPWILLLACAVMAAWSGCTWFWNLDRNRRTWWWMGADAVVTVAVVAVSRYVLGETLLRQSYLGVTVYWMVAAPMVIAIWRGPVVGFVIGAVIGLVEFLQAPTLAARAWLDLVCMMLVPALVGLVASEVDALMRQRDNDRAVAAALAERERLNRIMHDGVLQVLAMVEHEGGDLGEKGRRLARLAGDQASRLRALLQDKRIDPDGAPSSGTTTDLVAMVTRHQSRSVSVSVMAGAVVMSTQRALEIDAAISEALTNVVKHAGPDANAWILLEQEGDEVIVTVRDDGVGMTTEQAQQAVDAGRLGIQESITGRVRALGGSSRWRSQPGHGVEWEFRVPMGA
jgi:signal transduction histidine kinase